MDFAWVAIALGDVAWISLAFALGFVAQFIGLPPMVGFLATGFVLNAFGFVGGEVLQKLADLGITLLLFTVGLKLDLRTLMRPQVWAVTSIHIGLVVLTFGLAIFALASLGIAVFGSLNLGLSLMLAFALSFSSTVFVVKSLEDKGLMKSLHGRIAISILVMQDIFAVVFLAASTAKLPAVWAVLLVLLIPLRHLLHRLLDRTGHGELQILYGFVLALGGAELFELGGVKDDLGALILGLLISTHAKASEMAKTMLGFKDLFLVGFFLTIGMAGQLTLEALIIGTMLVPLVFIKSALFFWLMTRFKVRARTALLATLNLSNYSEFGLIVAAIGVTNGWLAAEWLVVIAIALSLSFVVAAPLIGQSDNIYRRHRPFWLGFQSEERLPDDQFIHTQDATIAVFGMGRVGTGAYEKMRELHGDTVLGVDIDADRVRKHVAAGRNVMRGAPNDADFWDKVDKNHSIELVMLALPTLAANLDAIEQLRESGFSGYIAATARYPDDNDVLQEAGATAVFDVYAEAGAGFAGHVEANRPI